MEKAQLSVPSVGDEFERAELGDERRTKRLRLIGEGWSEAPDRSVLQASKSAAQAEGAYRFLNNDSFSYVPIVEAHLTQTYERIAQEQTVIVAHDTTEVAYSGRVVREGLSRLRGNDQGFLAHVALAITGDGARRPLGVVAFAPWVRTGDRRSKTKNGRRLTGNEYAKKADKESNRWGKTVQDVNSRARGASLIHVMDREADAYPLLAQLQTNHCRFTVRLCKDRIVRTGDQEQDATELIKQSVRKLEGLFEQEVPISRRLDSTTPRRSHGLAPREARQAKLQFAATTLQLKRPRYLSDEPEWLTINVVHVREVDCPAGAEPVEWLLGTSEPISTENDIKGVVEQYRTRWTIEEFFKALKTGCAIEKRQHESYDTLLKMVAICLPIAWRMLLLRALARSMPQEPATAALSQVQVQVLKACSLMKLPPTPTARQAFEAVALLGGHHKSNGDPGWIVIGRGMEYLLALERGWKAREKNEIDD
jgi:hypothetical protein